MAIQTDNEVAVVVNEARSVLLHDRKPTITRCGRRKRVERAVNVSSVVLVCSFGTQNSAFYGVYASAQLLATRQRAALNSS